ncbi:MAG: PAQR family membrane homeostasis protein TrhA [Propionibacteriaceae bacterium]
MTTTPEVKPRLRGWFHVVMSPVSLIAGLLLVALAPSQSLRLACVVYLLSAYIMFTNSGVYHRGPWSPAVKQVFRRLDHSFIYVFIAGTYTPLCYALLSGASRWVLLILIWSCALAGMLFRIFWLSAPRYLYTVLYVVMGWAAVWWMLPMYRAGGIWPLVWIVIGGVIYTLGAVAYGMKKPNMWPSWFGFHEVFHLCTVLAAVAHYIGIWLAIFR